jgi:acetyl/propionyl-CoA carboxylase alpha subunit
MTERFFLKSLSQKEPIEIKIEKEKEAYRLQFLEKFFFVSVNIDANAVRGSLKIKEKIFPFFFLKNKNSLQIWINGEVYHFEFSEKKQENQIPLAKTNQLEAPMPGRILKILVKERQPFQEGEPLVVMESMKMEMTLSAPYSGKIKKIRCEEGKLVEMGEVLIEMDVENA